MVGRGSSVHKGCEGLRLGSVAKLGRALKDYMRRRDFVADQVGSLLKQYRIMSSS